MKYSDYFYENLASAIVYQAVLDYREAKVQIKNKPAEIERLREAIEVARITATDKMYRDFVRAEKDLVFFKDVKKECLQFFHSRWFEILTKIDGDVLAEKLEKEVA